MATLTKFVDGKEVPMTAQDIANMEQAARDWEAFKAEEAKTQDRKDRAAEYPPIGDQLDALFKAGVFPADMAATIQAVKDKYPKG
jgi:hypothetical protein